MKYVRKLVRELIVISGLAKLRLSDFTKKVTGFCTAAIENPTIAPNLNPTPLEIKAKNDLLLEKIAERAEVEKDLKARTISINTLRDEILYLINNAWCSQIQIAVKGDMEKVLKLGFLIKGIITGKAMKVIGMAFESHPIISSVGNGKRLQHNLSIINSASRKTGVPKDALRIDIYQQIGGLTPPTDIDKMKYIGSASCGKFRCNFVAADINTMVYYIAVYIDKITRLPIQISPVASAVVS